MTLPVWARQLRGIFGEEPLPERGTLIAKAAARAPQIVKPEPVAATRVAAGFHGVSEVHRGVAALREALDSLEALCGDAEPAARCWEQLQHRFERLSVDARALSARCRIGARRAHQGLDGAYCSACGSGDRPVVRELPDGRGRCSSSWHTVIDAECEGAQ